MSITGLPPVCNRSFEDFPTAFSEWLLGPSGRCRELNEWFLQLGVLLQGDAYLHAVNWCFLKHFQKWSRFQVWWHSRFDVWDRRFCWLSEMPIHPSPKEQRSLKGLEARHSLTAFLGYYMWFPFSRCTESPQPFIESLSSQVALTYKLLFKFASWFL